MASKKRETVGIIGLGKFGMNVAKELASSGVNILCIDKNDYKVREILEYCEYAYVTRDLSKSNLEELGFATCSTVIICIGEEIDISVLTTLNLISLGVKKVIAKAISEDQGKILEKLGAQVIFPERDSALLLSKALLSKNIIDFISLGNDIEVSEIAANDTLTLSLFAIKFFNSLINWISHPIFSSEFSTILFLSSFFISVVDNSFCALVLFSAKAFSNLLRNSTKAS